MCEYTPGCTLSDDPLATALWTQKKDTLKRAVLVFRCHKERHPVGAVFDIPDRGRVLVSPHQKMLRRSIYVDPTEPDAVTHQHAALYPVSEIGEGQTFQGRCRCGTWSFDVLAALRRPVPWGRDNHGVPFMIGNYVSMADAQASRRLAQDERHAD